MSTIFVLKYRGMLMIGFTLSFEGNDADNSELEFYDAVQAMLGFQRPLAITIHLIVNGEVIIQAPGLKMPEFLRYRLNREVGKYQR